MLSYDSIVTVDLEVSASPAPSAAPAPTETPAAQDAAGSTLTTLDAVLIAAVLALTVTLSVVIVKTRKKH